MNRLSTRHTSTATRRHWLGWLLWPYLGAMIVMLVLAYTGRLPSSGLLRRPGVDKIFHFLIFGGAAFWLHLWLGGRRLRFVSLAAVIVLACASVEEAAQILSRYRNADLRDLASDVVGVLVFVSLAQILLRAAAARPPRAEAAAGCGDPPHR